MDDSDARPIEHGHDTVHQANMESSTPTPKVGKNEEENNLYYKMNDKRKKHAVIFNNVKFSDEGLKERLGSDKDCKRMKDCLINTLGFKVKVCENPAVLDIQKSIDELSNMTSSEVSCIVVVVMTHGFKGGFLAAKDLDYEKNLLFGPFTRDNTNLGGVPKIFFIQACRGHKVDNGVRHNGPEDRMPSHADILVLYSAVEGYKSFREVIVRDGSSMNQADGKQAVEGYESFREGSWMIQEICEQLEKLPSHEKHLTHKWHLLELMTFAISRVAVAYETNTYDPKIPETSKDHKKKGIPQMESTLTKLLNFSR